MSRFEKEILPFMEEEIMRKLRTYNVYSIKEYEEIRKAVRYSIRFCKKNKIVAGERIIVTDNVIIPFCKFNPADINESVKYSLI